MSTVNDDIVLPEGGRKLHNSHIVPPLQRTPEMVVVSYVAPALISSPFLEAVKENGEKGPT